MFGWLIKMFGFLKRKAAGKSGEKEIVNAALAQDWIIEKTRKDVKKLTDSLDTEFDIILSDLKGLKKIAVLIETDKESELSDSIIALAKELSLPESITFGSAQAYIEKSKNTIKNFQKENAKKIDESRITHEKDIGQMSQHLDSISARLARINEISSDRLVSDIAGMNKNIENINSLIERKNEYTEMIAESEEKFEKFKNEKDASETKITELKKNKEYAEFLAIEKEIEETERKIKEKKKALKSDFSAIDSAIKKFYEIEKEHEEILKKYQKDAEDAIIADEELRIIKALKALAARIEEIEPDSKKRAKVLAKVSSIDELYFQRFMTERENLHFDRNGLKRRQNIITVKKEVDDLEYKIKHLDDKMKTLSKDIVKLNHALGKTDIEDLKEKIEGDIEKLTGQKIELEIKLADEADIEQS